MGNFWQGAGAALVSGIGSMGANALNAISSKSAMKRAFEFNMQLQHDAQKYQKEMWQLANEYALPKNEIARLMEAGVNPAMAFSNAGGAPQAVPSSPTSGGVSPVSPSFGNSLGAAVASYQDAQRVENESDIAASVIDKNDAESNLLNKQAEEVESRKKLNDADYEIRSNPDYIKAMTENPGVRNALMRIDHDMRDLQYSYDLETYGIRVNSAELGYQQQELAYITSFAQLAKLNREYELVGSYIRYYDAGTAESKARAKVLRQDLDIRAGQAVFGTVQRDALQYCRDHGVKDSVSEEIVSFTEALASEYGAKVFDGVYSSEASAITANQESIYQKEHGQERRELEQDLVRKQGNYLTTSQWNMSIRTGLEFFRTAIDVGATVMTKGANKAAGSLVTPSHGSERMPLSPDAMDILRKIYKESEKRLIYTK